MRFFIILVALSLNTLLCAQLNTPFANFSPTDFESGRFLPYARVLNDEMHSGDSYTPHKRRDIERMLFSLRKADLLGASLPETQALTSLQHQYYEWSDARAVSLFHIAYEDFASQAAENGWIALAGGELVLQHNPEETIVTNQAFLAHLLDDRYTAGTHRFIFPEEACYGCTDLLGAVAEVDFDDGLGFRNIEWNIPIEVTYSDQEANRLLRVRISSEDQVLKTAFVLRSAGAASSIPLPENPPWPVPDPADPWMIQTNYQESTVSGNAYTLLSEDGIFDRPFIFVEGIDFGQTHGTLRNGFFGWYEFSSGNSANYSFLYNMPVLLQWLRSEGYDIIMLDFSHGSDHIERNAALLKHLIELVKGYKTGQEELVVAGASMGGQVSRVALREMELDGLDHCTRLWISMDSPHYGASIPMSLQHTLYEMKEISASAEDFVANYLEVPAAKQMLLAHAGGNNTERSAYQSYLNDLGFPEHCRNVALANGSGSGVPLGLSPGAPLLDYECEAFGLLLSKFYLLSHPGDPYHELSTPSSNLLSQTIFIEDTDCSGVSCILSALFAQHNAQSFVASDQPPYDTCPGGKRPSIAQFAAALNDELSGADNIELICETQVSDYYPDHSFIPTVSALGLNTELTVPADLSIEEEEPFPFDSFYAPETNTYHSELTNGMLSFIWHEITAGEPLLAGVLNQNLEASTFNFALPEHYILDPIIIDNGGELQINGEAAIHFGDDPALLPEPGSTMYVRTSECHPGEVVIDENGRILLGSESSQCSGFLDIRKGSILRVKEGGLLRLIEKSHVIIREGAKLVADGGTIDVSDGSMLIIEEGADFEINHAQPIFVSDPDSRIRIGGGIILATDVDATFTHLPDHSNGALVFEGSEMIHGDFSNRLYIRGSNTSDLLVEIAEHCELNTTPGFEELRIEDGLIRLHHSAMLSTTASFTLRNADVNGIDEPDGVVLYNAALIENCSVENCAFTALLNYESIRFLNDNLTNSPIRIHGGGYRVESCSLNASPIESWLRDYNARIIASSFSGCADAAVRDESIPLLRVVDSEFFNNDKGIFNSGGELLLRCNAFTGCEVGVVAGSFTYLNMSADAAAGYNYFDDNGTHIRFHAALGALLLNGYNAFLSFNNYVFYGNMAGNCDDECTLLLNASRNTWQYGSPLENTYEIHIPSILCDSSSPLNPFDGCYLQIVDKFPSDLTACGAADLPPQNVDLSGKSLQVKPKQKGQTGVDCSTAALLSQEAQLRAYAYFTEEAERTGAWSLKDALKDSAMSNSIIHAGFTDNCFTPSDYFVQDLLYAAALQTAGHIEEAHLLTKHLRECLHPGIQQEFAAWYGEALKQKARWSSDHSHIAVTSSAEHWQPSGGYIQSPNTKEVCTALAPDQGRQRMADCSFNEQRIPSEENAFQVSPNPGLGAFRISSSRIPDKDSRWDIEIRSLDGHSLMRVEGVGDWPELHLHDYAAGVYLISVSLDGQWLGTKRLVLMH